MSRNARTLSLLSVVLLVGSLVALVSEAPLVRADPANRIYNVDTAADDQFADPPIASACADDSPLNKDCTLRQALLLANSDNGASIINFVIPADTGDPDYGYTVDGFWTITPQFELPELNDPIDGTQIRGLATGGVPQIIIDGSALGPASGFILTSYGNAISNLAIINFSGTSTLTGVGVRISGGDAASNQIVGSYIGVNPRTLAAAPNQRAGIQIEFGANNNRIGTTSLGNVISGNGSGLIQGDGILLQSTSQNIIQNNLIGVVPSGINSTPLANTGYGIEIAASSSNTIGGTLAERNIVSSNMLAGILLSGSSTANNTIGTNWIGVNRLLGTGDSGNGSHGIHIFNTANNNTLAGSSSAPLIISGNGGYGVLISGNGTNANTLKSAYIGVNSGGTAIVANDSGGVRIQDNASNNSIGTSAAGNVISGNTNYGISLGRAVFGSTLTSANTIRNNIIGLNASGLAPVPNTLGGIQIDLSARNTIIGGLASGEGNVISGNGTGAGVIVNATAVVSTTISGNIIGLRRSVASGPYIAAAGNQGGGISVASGAQQVQIGGTLDRANTIAFNQGNGVVVGTGSVAVQINSNSVTTNTLGGIIVTGVATPTLIANIARANGTSIFGGSGIELTNTPNPIVTENVASQNSHNGISISNAPGATITNNTIATNGQNGLRVSASDASTIRFNTVTTSTLNGISVDTSSPRVTLDRNTATGNGQSGISIVGSNTLTVTLNTLSRNTGGSGLIVTGPASSGQVANNTIESNGANGLTIVAPSATNNLTITGNLFQKNTGSGVIVTGNATNLLIQSNYVISNTINGIQLGDGGAGLHPQRVNISSNTISRNGFTSGAGFPIIDPLLQHYGIVFSPATAGTPGTSTNPNHDIDPPIPSSLVVSQGQAQGGVIYGRVLADSTSAACTTNPVADCTIQLFNTDPTSRDGQGNEQISAPVTLTSNGYFTSTLGFVPKQLAITATDKTGNTSEFAVFNADPKIAALTPQSFNAKPGDVITITRQLTNTGNIAFTKLHLIVTTNRDHWVLTPEPISLFSLAPGQSRTISVTLRLPTGSDSQVQAGSSGLITTTIDSSSTGADAVSILPVVDTVNILPRVVLSVAAGLNGSGLPGTVVAYPHIVTNNGNITTTVTFAVATTDNGVPAPTWVTTFEPTSLTLAPGQSGATTVRVTVSPGSQDGKTVQTTLTATPSVGGTPDMTQVKSVVDTTTTTLQQVASMVPDRQTDAGATETVQFRHFVTNNSNGTATFKLVASSSQGSVITFTSLTSGVPLVNGTTFSLPNTPGSNTFDFYVNVTVDRRLLPGQKDLVTVILTDAGGGVIGGASVQDTINVTRGVLYPRLWLPVVVKP